LQEMLNKLLILKAQFERPICGKIPGLYGD